MEKWFALREGHGTTVASISVFGMPTPDGAVVVSWPPIRVRRWRAPTPVQMPPRGPRGPQLWLRYPGWEKDANGWR